MSLLDLVIVIVLATGFILGYKDGFVRKLIGLIGFIAAAYLSIKLANRSGRIIEDLLGIEYYLAELIGGAMIFIFIILITAIIKRVVHPFDKVNNVINQIIGGVVGMAQMLLFLSAVFLLLNIFDQPKLKVKSNSVLYSSVFSVIPSLINYIKDYTPSTKNVIKEYINQKDSDTLGTETDVDTLDIDTDIDTLK